MIKSLLLLDKSVIHSGLLGARNEIAKYKKKINVKNGLGVHALCTTHDYFFFGHTVLTY